MRQDDEILNLLPWPLADYVVPVHKLDTASPHNWPLSRKVRSEEPVGGGRGLLGVHTQRSKAPQTLGVARKGSPTSD